MAKALRKNTIWPRGNFWPASLINMLIAANSSTETSLRAIPVARFMPGARHCRRRPAIDLD